MEIEKADILSDVRRALQEDIGDEDVSAALLPADLAVEAEIISREPMVVCGKPWVDMAFAEIDSSIQITWLVNEGDWLNAPASLCQITGRAQSILTAERTALNFFQTLSATATKVYHFVKALSGSSTRLLDTRKTIPGLRKAQKYAVACAGGTNHRMGLYDAFLIKENHIKACGSIAKAITQAKALRPNLFVEVEVENLEEFAEALEAKPDRILLDNFSKEKLKEAVNINRKYGCQLEASGGIDLSNIAEFAQTGIHYISVGALTKNIEAIDLSLLVRMVK